MIVQLCLRIPKGRLKMELQQIRVEKLIPYPSLSAIKKIPEVLGYENQASAQQIELNEREEFVKRIEAFCDCV